MLIFEFGHTYSQYHIICLVSCAIIKFESMENSKMDTSNQNDPFNNIEHDLIELIVTLYHIIKLTLS